MKVGDKVEVMRGENSGRKGIITGEFIYQDVRNPNKKITVKRHWVIMLEDGIRILEPEGNLKVIKSG